MIEKIDKWKHLRTELFGNVEPEIELIGLTVPGEADGKHFFTTDRYSEGALESSDIEAQVAQAAATSYGKKPKDPSELNKRLIRLGHLTPLEAIQFNFRISGISKLCGAQLSRHRVGQGHISGSRRYQKQKPAFVYPLLYSIYNEAEARIVYQKISDVFDYTFEDYNALIEGGASKQDIRYLIPGATATERVQWINARALRDFFRLRLHSSAEPEIRRLAWIMLEIVSGITPSLFEDIKEKFSS